MAWKEEFPDFDPLGGGVRSDMLFVLEKPGPKTSRQGGGSGLLGDFQQESLVVAASMVLV